MRLLGLQFKTRRASLSLIIELQDRLLVINKSKFNQNIIYSTLYLLSACQCNIDNIDIIFFSEYINEIEIFVLNHLFVIYKRALKIGKFIVIFIRIYYIWSLTLTIILHFQLTQLNLLVLQEKNKYNPLIMEIR